MRLFDFLFKKKDTSFVGIRYCATGVFGYSFKNGEMKVFNISSQVLPNPDIYMNGFNQELVHKHYDGSLTMVPGVRRTIVDRLGKLQGYYEYVALNEYRIVVGSVMASVKSSENGWKVFNGTKQLAHIHRIPEREIHRFEADMIWKQLF